MIVQKQKLRLDELNVDSFVTDTQILGKAQTNTEPLSLEEQCTQNPDCWERVTEVWSCRPCTWYATNCACSQISGEPFYICPPVPAPTGLPCTA